MEIKGRLQTAGIRILILLFQFLFLIHTVVIKFVLEFLCLTVALSSCLLAIPARVKPSAICHMRYLHSAQDICGGTC